MNVYVSTYVAIMIFKLSFIIIVLHCMIVSRRHYVRILRYYTHVFFSFWSAPLRTDLNAPSSVDIRASSASSSRSSFKCWCSKRPIPMLQTVPSPSASVPILTADSSDNCWYSVPLRKWVFASFESMVRASREHALRKPGERTAALWTQRKAPRAFQLRSILTLGCPFSNFDSCVK